MIRKSIQKIKTLLWKNNKPILFYSFDIGTDFRFTIWASVEPDMLINIEHIDKFISFKAWEDVEFNQFLTENNIMAEFTMNLEQIILRFS